MSADRRPAAVRTAVAGERLPHRGESWSQIRRRLDIVKAHHRAILGHTHTGLVQATHHAQGGQIVEG